MARTATDAAGAKEEEEEEKMKRKVGPVVEIVDPLISRGIGYQPSRVTFDDALYALGNTMRHKPRVKTKRIVSYVTVRMVYAGLAGNFCARFQVGDVLLHFNRSEVRFDPSAQIGDIIDVVMRRRLAQYKGIIK
jgi:hypothetical protein